MPGTLRRPAFSLLWGVALASLLVACAPAQPSNQAAPPPSAPASVPASSQAPAPAAPATEAGAATAWTVAIAEEAASLDPATGTAAAGSLQAQLHLFDPLVAFEGPTFTPAPKLAESWTPLDDQTWEFKLRRGVKFHNGDDFTAADVRYSYGLYGDERSARRHNLASVTALEVVDPYTIRLTTNAPNPGLLANLASLSILPHETRERLGPDAFG